MKHVTIIAEAGTNHNGSLKEAQNLVDVAKEAGADSIKFQIIYPEGLYLPKFFRDGQYVDNEVFSKRKNMMLGDHEYRILADYCRERSFSFSASVFDKRGLNLLNDFDVEYIKIASCDLNNSPFLKQAAELGRKLIISTGMSSLGEIEQAITDIVATGNNDIVVMHCVSIYPAPLESMNLQYTRVLKKAFGFPVGISDHTEGNIASAISIGLGVDWIEKHFTLNKKSEGFDHAYALEPGELGAFIAQMRSSEQACNRRSIKVGYEESLVKVRARRALYAAREIQEGEFLHETDVAIVRPEGPMSPNDLYRIVGKRTVRSIHQYEPLTPKMVD